MKGRNLAELRQAVNLNASQMGGQSGKIGRIFSGSPCSSRKKGQGRTLSVKNRPARQALLASDAAARNRAAWQSSVTREGWPSLGRVVEQLTGTSVSDATNADD
jgi:hypothetical protein